MQLYFENFGVEGTPEELAIFAKNYEADEIRMSDRDECSEEEMHLEPQVKKIGIMIGSDNGSDYMKIDEDGTVIIKADRIYSTESQKEICIFELPKYAIFGSKEADDIYKSVVSYLGSDIKVIPIPHGSRFCKQFL